MDSKPFPILAPRRTPWVALCTLLVAAPLAATALAQFTGGTGVGGTGGTTAAGGLVVTLLTIDGKDPGAMKELVGSAQCDNAVPVVFELRGVPSDRESIDVYTGDNCNSTDRNGSTTSAVRCKFITNVASPTSSAQALEIKISAAELVNCDTASESTPTIWFLAVDVTESAEDVGTRYAKYNKLAFDLRAPEPPSKVKGGSGENQIPVTWTNKLSKIEKFIVYVDSGSGSGSADASIGAADAGAGRGGATRSECGSGLLREGATAPGENLPSGLVKRSYSGATLTSGDLSGDDIDGKSAAVAVVAVDEAGNQSVLSNVACVFVVPTEGFWDRYQANGGTVDGGCPCAALGPAHAESAWPIALVLGFISVSARRRRSR